MIRNAAFRSLFAVFLLAGITAGAARAQDLKSFEQKTTVHKLANGWTFIIVERPTAPVFSFATIADVGSAQEVPGITGLAHMFEHMAFKGTPNIGTTDYAAEKKALEALEAAYQAWQAERLAPKPDPKKLETLLAGFKAKQEEAARHRGPQRVRRHPHPRRGRGHERHDRRGSDLVTSTRCRPTRWSSSPSSNPSASPIPSSASSTRSATWCSEERRMSYESRPIGRLVEQFLTTAYQSHPYQQPGIGYPSDLQSISITDAQKFFDTYYAPSNLTTAVVGDVKAAALIPILEKYFGRIPARPAPPPLRTVEPPQIAERIVVLEDTAQPFYLEGYHKPASTHPDQPVYDAIDDILSNGRTSRLYRSLVRDKKLAVDVQSFSGFPGEKYPNLWAALAVPAVGVTNEQVQAALREEIDRLKREDVTDEELAKFKTRAKADLLRRLRSNQGLAEQLAEHQRLYGDWRELFRYIDRLDKVTKADIRRVAGETFQAPNRTVAMIVNREAQKTPRRPLPARRSRRTDDEPTLSPNHGPIPALLVAASLSLPVLAQAQATRAGDLRYPPLPAFEIPQPERVVLDNGLVVMLLEDHELPLVEATALVRAGGRFDPAGKVGLADLAAEVMRTGGTREPARRRSWTTSWRAAPPPSRPAAARTWSRVTLNSLKADFPEVLKTFADVLRRPAFDADEAGGGEEPGPRRGLPPERRSRRHPVPRVRQGRLRPRLPLRPHGDLRHPGRHPPGGPRGLAQVRVPSGPHRPRPGGRLQPRRGPAARSRGLRRLAARPAVEARRGRLPRSSRARASTSWRRTTSPSRPS